MPITACFACMTFLALILLIPILPASLILLGRGRKGTALVLLGIPVGMIVVSILCSILVFALLWHYSVRMSRTPAHLFADTFGFEPTQRADALEGFCDPGLD